ncbi:MAG TPA: four helix bundle protein, partial [Elusimicrobia bacterium]|nr:four helix bundle protein [Elusimicrobiota bacterium]
MDETKYSFESLEVYKLAVEYRKKLYELAKKLPTGEKYNLCSQLKRVAVSITNNIAEGHGRYHYQENIQFLRQSRGFVEESIDDINVCVDEKYAEYNYLNKLKEEGYFLIKKINGYI